ncbi:hypothetical protein Q5692_15280, partial [Microcoleus sp. C2C3]|uniref:hypothetical protein n=1 Tax=unclassified Microcoleus TaxID=2642155 RepID=UPI002FD27181
CHWFSHRMVLDLTFFISSTSLEKWYNKLRQEVQELRSQLEAQKTSWDELREELENCETTRGELRSENSDL